MILMFRRMTIIIGVVVNAAFVTSIDVSLFSGDQRQYVKYAVYVPHRTPVGSLVDVFSSKISYNEFLFPIKTIRN